jgi:DNA-binding MarR family transcriptional regulator
LDFDINNLENMMFDYIDQFKVLLSQDTWENILLNCTKNEMLVLLMLYRGTDVNMSQIADYLNAPLNTTTGIVSRMEKKKMITRVRSEQDKRVVTIALTELGSKEIGNIMSVFLDYGQRILGLLTSEEMSLLSNVIQKLVKIAKEPKNAGKPVKRKIRKIVID